MMCSAADVFRQAAKNSRHGCDDVPKIFKPGAGESEYLPALYFT